MWTIVPLTFSLVPLPPLSPSQSQSTVYIDSVWLGGGGGMLSWVRPCSVRSWTLARFWTYKISIPPQTKSQGWKGASDRLTPAAKSISRSIWWDFTTGRLTWGACEDSLVLWQTVDLHVKGQCSLRTKIHCKKGYRLSRPQLPGCH